MAHLTLKQQIEVYDYFLSGYATVYEDDGKTVILTDTLTRKGIKFREHPTREVISDWVETQQAKRVVRAWFLRRKDHAKDWLMSWMPRKANKPITQPTKPTKPVEPDEHYW